MTLLWTCKLATWLGRGNLAASQYCPRHEVVAKNSGSLDFGASTSSDAFRLNLRQLQQGSGGINNLGFSGNDRLP